MSKTKQRGAERGLTPMTFICSDCGDETREAYVRREPRAWLFLCPDCHKRRDGAEEQER